MRAGVCTSTCTKAPPAKARARATAKRTADIPTCSLVRAHRTRTRTHTHKCHSIYSVFKSSTRRVRTRTNDCGEWRSIWVINSKCATHTHIHTTFAHKQNRIRHERSPPTPMSTLHNQHMHTHTHPEHTTRSRLWPAQQQQSHHKMGSSRPTNRPTDMAQHNMHAHACVRDFSAQPADRLTVAGWLLVGRHSTRIADVCAFDYYAAVQ